MATPESIARVTDQATEYIVGLRGPRWRRIISRRLVRAHVRWTLYYLAMATDKIGVYEVVDDLIYYLAEQYPGEDIASIGARIDAAASTVAFWSSGISQRPHP